MFLDSLPLVFRDDGKIVCLRDLTLFPAEKGCVRCVRKRAGPVRKKRAEEIRLLLNKRTIPRIAASFLAGHAPFIDSGPDKSFHFLDFRDGIYPFLDIIVPAVVQGLNGYLGKVAAGKENEKGRVVLGANLLKKGNSVHPGHGIVRDDRIELVLADQSECFGRRCAAENRKTRLQFKILFQHIQDIDIIINTQK